jgi:hypothetical protein
MSPAAVDAGERTAASLHQHRPGLTYRDADVAIEVAEALARRDPGPPSGATVLAVVDGAWRWRLAQPTRDEDALVAALVADYCRTTTSGGTP